MAVKRKKIVCIKVDNDTLIYNPLQDERDNGDWDFQTVTIFLQDRDDWEQNDIEEIGRFEVAKSPYQKRWLRGMNLHDTFTNNEFFEDFVNIITVVDNEEDFVEQYKSEITSLPAELRPIYIIQNAFINPSHRHHGYMLDAIAMYDVAYIDDCSSSIIMQFKPVVTAETRDMTEEQRRQKLFDHFKTLGFIGYGDFMVCDCELKNKYKFKK